MDVRAAVRSIAEFEEKLDESKAQTESTYRFGSAQLIWNGLPGIDGRELEAGWR